MTPALALGIAPRAFGVEEVLVWREDWETRGPSEEAA
jgi:hypothetical protein